MKCHNTKRTRQKKESIGKGFLNTLINKLPVELHVPGYNYCGPGTKLEKRLQRNDQGVNLLDEACKSHDIAYSKSSDLEHRHKADQLLASKAWERFKAKNSSIGEKLTALGVSTAMKAKVKLGMGSKRSSNVRLINKRVKKRSSLTFNKAVKKARFALKNRKPADIQSAVNIAVDAVKGLKKSNRSRIIPIPKTGGFLPLIPLFAGLSALGALAGGASGIASAVNKAKEAQQQLKETQRHNEQMEAIAMGKGLTIKPFKRGLGLFVNPYSFYQSKKNFQ